MSKIFFLDSFTVEELFLIQLLWNHWSDFNKEKYYNKSLKEQELFPVPLTLQQTAIRKLWQTLGLAALGSQLSLFPGFQELSPCLPF